MERSFQKNGCPTLVLSIFLSFPLFYFLDNLGLFTRAVNVQYILLYIEDLKNTLYTGKKEGNTGWEIVFQLSKCTLQNVLNDLRGHLLTEVKRYTDYILPYLQP